MNGWCAGAGNKVIKSFDDPADQELYDKAHKMGRLEKGRIQSEAAKELGASINVVRVMCQPNTRKEVESCPIQNTDPDAIAMPAITNAEQTLQPEVPVGRNPATPKSDPSCGGTPRTKEVSRFSHHGYGYLETQKLIEHAESLKRELAAVTAERDAALKTISSVSDTST